MRWFFNQGQLDLPQMSRQAFLGKKRIQIKVHNVGKFWHFHLLCLHVLNAADGPRALDGATLPA